MRLIKDTSVGAFAIKVPCVCPKHYIHDRGGRYPRKSIMFTLAEGFSDLDGKPFVDYYCDDCVVAEKITRFIV